MSRALLPQRIRRARRDADLWDRTRERLLTETRALTRASGQFIRDWHAGRQRDAQAADLHRRAETILRRVHASPEFRHAGFVQQGLGEYVEATLLPWLGRGGRGAIHLADVPSDAFLLGLADAVGELRRFLLTRLLRDDVASARRALDQMETLFGLLCDIEASDSYVPLRAKRDQARSILERTRSDLVNAKKTKDLEKKIDDLGALLDEAEGRRAKKPSKGKSDDLDVDSAWSRD